jgi:hypothetical protein
MILRTSLLLVILVAALAGMFSSNHKVRAINIKPTEKVAGPELKGWSRTLKTLAEDMMSKYGMPGEFTESMLIWKNNGTWDKTILYREEMKHDFPIHHADVLEQTVTYRVPEGKLDDLSKFNGSITANRTNGTLTVRCMNENLNILTLNLAYEIIKGKKTVSEARLAHYKNAAEIMNGRIPEAGQYLSFTSDVNAPDPR